MKEEKLVQYGLYICCATSLSASIVALKTAWGNDKDKSKAPSSRVHTRIDTNYDSTIDGKIKDSEQTNLRLIIHNQKSIEQLKTDLLTLKQEIENEKGRYTQIVEEMIRKAKNDLNSTIDGFKYRLEDVRGIMKKSSFSNSLSTR